MAGRIRILYEEEKKKNISFYCYFVLFLHWDFFSCHRKAEMQRQLQEHDLAVPLLRLFQERQETLRFMEEEAVK